MAKKTSPSTRQFLTVSSLRGSSASWRTDVAISLHLQKIIFFLLFFFLVLIRFWKSAEWFSFNFDEEYQALMAWSQVKDFHPVWIGVSASNFGFYLGPAFTYLNAFLFWLSRGDLSILAYFSSFFGILTTLSLYYVASQIFSKKVGLISAIFYGFSAFIIYFDRRFWNPTSIMFITIWLLYSLYKAQKDTRWFILTTVLMAASLHVHLSLLVYWPLVIYLVLSQFRRIAFKTWLLCFAVYLLLVSPLIVFDFNHNFDNLVGPIRFLLNREAGVAGLGLSQLFLRLGTITSSMGRLIFMTLFTNLQEEHGLGAHSLVTAPHLLLKIFSVLAMAYFFFRTYLEKKNRVLALMIASILIFYILYPQWGAEYYLLSFFILFCMVLGIFFQNISWKLLAPLLATFIFFNTLTIFNTTQSQYGLVSRRNLINQVMLKIGDSSFGLETVGKDPRKYHPYGGWHYFFQTYGNRPTTSSADEFFGWIYPDEIRSEKIEYRIIISEQLLELPQSSIRKGEILVGTYTSGAFSGHIFKVN